MGQSNLAQKLSSETEETFTESIFKSIKNSVMPKVSQEHFKKLEKNVVNDNKKEIVAANDNELVPVAANDNEVISKSASGGGKNKEIDKIKQEVIVDKNLVNTHTDSGLFVLGKEVSSDAKTLQTNTKEIEIPTEEESKTIIQNIEKAKQMVAEKEAEKGLTGEKDKKRSFKEKLAYHFDPFLEVEYEEKRIKNIEVKSFWSVIKANWKKEKGFFTFLKKTFFQDYLTWSALKKVIPYVEKYNHLSNEIQDKYGNIVENTKKTGNAVLKGKKLHKESKMDLAPAIVVASAGLKAFPGALLAGVKKVVSGNFSGTAKETIQKSLIPHTKNIQNAYARANPAERTKIKSMLEKKGFSFGSIRKHAFLLEFTTKVVDKLIPGGEDRSWSGILYESAPITGSLAAYDTMKKNLTIWSMASFGLNVGLDATLFLGPVGWAARGAWTLGKMAVGAAAKTGSTTVAKSLGTRALARGIYPKIPTHAGKLSAKQITKAIPQNIKKTILNAKTLGAIGTYGAVTWVLDYVFNTERIMNFALEEGEKILKKEWEQNTRHLGPAQRALLERAGSETIGHIQQN